MRAMRVIRIFALAFAWFLAGLLAIWAVAALYFDLPFPWLRIPAAVLSVFVIAAVIFAVRSRWLRWIVCVAFFAAVLVWWLSLRPSNHRAWQADVAQTAWAETNGDRVTIHNFRDCDYRAEFDYTCRWETKTVDLSEIRGVDLFFTHWGSPWIAHPILSFQFGDNDHVAFSIETRKEIGEGYSAIRGFFRQYELIYIVTDERDVIRLRTNYRTAEEVSLYHLKATREKSRAVFLEYIRRVNQLHDHPEWYNALTSNCTTNIYAEIAAANGASPGRMVWRSPLNGKDDEKAYYKGALAGNLPYPELERRALINPAAQAADKDPDFSSAIRKGRPGFDDDSNAAPNKPPR